MRRILALFCYIVLYAVSAHWSPILNYTHPNINNTKMKQRINSLFALRTIRLTASSILIAMFLLVLPLVMQAQQAENSRVISYQGSVTTNSGSQLTGDHLITTTLYSDANGTTAVWSGTYKQQITGGVFTVLLGSGAYPLPGAQDFSKTLWIGIKIDGGEVLKPLTQLTGAPYSVSIADRSVTKDKIAVDYVGSIRVNGKKITGKGSSLNLVDGLNTSLLYDEGTNSLSLNFIGGGGIGTVQPQGNACSDPYWRTTGNPGTNTCQIFGSLDNNDVIMVANGTEQMRMPNGSRQDRSRDRGNSRRGNACFSSTCAGSVCLSPDGRHDQSRASSSTARASARIHRRKAPWRHDVHATSRPAFRTVFGLQRE